MLKLSGIKTVSQTHIIPILLRENKRAIEVSEELRAKGYYIPAIRPPTVPEGSSRLRVSLTADININDIIKVIDNYK